MGAIIQDVARFIRFGLKRQGMPNRQPAIDPFRREIPEDGSRGLGFRSRAGFGERNASRGRFGADRDRPWTWTQFNPMHREAHRIRNSREAQR